MSGGTYQPEPVYVVVSDHLLIDGIVYQRGETIGVISPAAARARLREGTIKVKPCTS